MQSREVSNYAVDPIARRLARLECTHTCASWILKTCTLELVWCVQRAHSQAVFCTAMKHYWSKVPFNFGYSLPLAHFCWLQQILLFELRGRGRKWLLQSFFLQCKIRLSKMASTKSKTWHQFHNAIFWVTQLRLCIREDSSTLKFSKIAKLRH